MGTLYDLLGALPGDDAEGLRVAFRKAAKATHPDMNADDPEAPRRFRELMRAYDILTDADQRTTYDELLAIALQPPAAEKSTHVYERVRKYASNTMAATIISGLLVAGYTLFGHFSNPPVAAEFLTSKTAGQPDQTAPAATAEADIESVRPTPPADAEAANAMIVTAALSRSIAPASNSTEAAHRFTLDNLWTRRDPVLAVTYLDRDIILFVPPSSTARSTAWRKSSHQPMPPGRRFPRRLHAKCQSREFRKPDSGSQDTGRKIPLPPRRAPMIAALTP